MESGIRNLLVYFVELVKMLIVTVGTMGFKLKIRRLGLFVLLLSAIAILIVAHVRFISLINGLLAVTTATLLLKGKRRLLCVFLVYLSISMLDIMTAAIIMLITELDTAALYDSTAYRVFVNTFSIMFLMVIAVIRIRLKKPCLYHIKHMRIAYIITSIVSQICFLLYLTPTLILGFDEYSMPLITVGLSFSGLFFIISNVFLVESVFYKNKFKSLYLNSHEQSENLIDYVEERIESAKEKQKIYHDMSYHLLSLQSLIKNGDSDELENYIDRLTGRFVECSHVVSTGNHQLNSIISGCIAKYPGTEVKITGIMPNEIAISHHDFCVILSNLLDNAFKMSAGKVKIEIKLNGNMLFIRIANPVRKRVKIVDNIVQSSHGIGMLNVSEYVEKNSGKIFYRCNDKCFIADLYLNV